MFCLLSYSKACDTFLVLVILVHSKHSTNNCKFSIMKRNNEYVSTETPPKRPKLLENFKLALVCCSDEWRGWVSNNSPNSESCTSTSPFHPLELTGYFLVTVKETLSKIYLRMTL